MEFNVALITFKCQSFAAELVSALLYHVYSILQCKISYMVIMVTQFVTNLFTEETFILWNHNAPNKLRLHWTPLLSSIIILKVVCQLLNQKINPCCLYSFKKLGIYHFVKKKRKKKSKLSLQTMAKKFTSGNLAVEIYKLAFCRLYVMTACA